jgi:transposase
MIPVEAWTTIRYLHAQGKPIRAIAKELGIARNTVRAAVREEGPPRYSRPKRPNPKLEPFTAQIAVMFFEQDLIGSRIFRELRKLGYTGGSTALYDHLRTLKAASPSSRLTERFETPPAQQAQFDWSPYTIPLGGSLIKVIVFCLTLAFSRRKFYWPSLNETQGSIFEALEAGLRHFGGSPKELLVDNPRAFVSNPNPLHFQWNAHFLQLCGHYAIKPVACQPGRPRTKGKVERPFFYLEQHLIKGNAWDSFDAFARDLTAFAADELDHLVHSTTGERPIDRFSREKDLLTPLPALPFVGTHEEMRKVSWDCLVSFGGSRYSVPWQYAGKHVWLRASQGVTLVVRSQKGEEIASHRLSAQKGATVIDQRHYEGLRKALPKTRTMLEEAFVHLFPDHRWFAEAVFIQHRPNGAAHLRAILALAEVYPREALVTAFTLARQYNTYSHRFIRGLLESAGSMRQEATPILPFRPPRGPVVADLGIYQRILEAGR